MTTIVVPISKPVEGAGMVRSFFWIGGNDGQHITFEHPTAISEYDWQTLMDTLQRSKPAFVKEVANG